MKAIALAAVAATLGAGMALAADPLAGNWRTSPDDNGHTGLIHVAPCGDKLCGTLVTAYGADGKQIASKNIGRDIISATVSLGDGQYKGRVYSPDRDKTYSSRLQLSGDSLRVRGCVFGICRDGGTWQRVP